MINLETLDKLEDYLENMLKIATLQEGILPKPDLKNNLHKYTFD